MERQCSFLFFSFLFFSCDKQQESSILELTPTEPIETLSKAEFLQQRDERFSEIRNQALQVIDGGGSSDNPDGGICTTVTPVGQDYPTACNCTIQVTEVNIPETVPPFFQQNSFEFNAIENCEPLCGLFNTFDFRSNGLCVPSGPGCFTSLPSISTLIAMGEIPFNCAIGVFQEFHIAFAAYHENCASSLIPTVPESSITFIVKCKGNTEFNPKCDGAILDGPSSYSNSTGPVTINLGNDLDGLMNISLEGECGCSPVATPM